jgi:vacuolar-type H+-ATPase subunit I/STV1
LHITKKGDGVYNIKCSISAYNTTTREAWIYLEIDKITKNKLQSSIESTGAKGVDIIPFSSNMLGQRKTIDEESASALKSVYDFSNKHGWILVTRGTPSVDLSPESPGQTLSPETMRRQEEDVLVQERVAEENPGDFNTGEKRDFSCSTSGGEEVHKKQRTAAVSSIGVNAFTPMISELLSDARLRDDDVRRREDDARRRETELKEEKAALKEENTSLKEDNATLKEKNAVLKRKYKAKLAALQEKYDTLKAETPIVHASEFQGSNEATDAEKDRMLAKLDAENQELQERLIANISDRDDLRARLEAEIESLLTRLDTRAATNANLQARLDAKENDITAGASEYNRRIAALEQNVSDIRAEKEANNADYLLCAADLEERIGRLEAENSSFRDKLRILKAFLDSV